MIFNTNEYEEWFFLNGNNVSEKKFMNSFDRNTKGYTDKTLFRLAQKILRGEPTKIKQNVYYYEERHVKTGEIKKQEYETYSHTWRQRLGTSKGNL